MRWTLADAVCRDVDASRNVFRMHAAAMTKHGVCARPMAVPRVRVDGVARIGRRVAPPVIEYSDAAWADAEAKVRLSRALFTLQW